MVKRIIISINIKIVYLQLIWYLFTYQLVSRFVFFNWYSFTFKLVSICTSLTHFLIGIIFEFRQKGENIPWLIFFKKRREEYVFISFVLFLTPLLMIDKKGEKNLSLYAYLYACFMFLLSSFGIKALFIEHVYFWYIFIFFGIKSL